MAPRDFDGFEKLGGEFDSQPTAYPEWPGAFLSETHRDYSYLAEPCADTSVRFNRCQGLATIAALAVDNDGSVLR